VANLWDRILGLMSVLCYWIFALKITTAIFAETLEGIE
jgi:hypothetical protein